MPDSAGTRGPLRAGDERAHPRRGSPHPPSQRDGKKQRGDGERQRQPLPSRSIPLPSPGSAQPSAFLRLLDFPSPYVRDVRRDSNLMDRRQKGSWRNHRSLPWTIGHNRTRYFASFQRMLSGMRPLPPPGIALDVVSVIPPFPPSFGALTLCRRT